MNYLVKSKKKLSLLVVLILVLSIFTNFYYAENTTNDGASDGTSDGTNDLVEITRAEMTMELIMAKNIPLEMAKDSPFTDVPMEHWAVDYIYTAVNAGLVKGYEDGTFKPEDNVTRAQFATLIMNNFFVPAYKDMDSMFIDVLPEDWCFFVVNSVASAGIIDGYSDGTFRPNEYVTRNAVNMSFQRLKTDDGTNDCGEISRAEMVKELVMAKNIPLEMAKDSPFIDVPMDHWAADYIYTAVNARMLSGHEDGTFKPEDNVTRAAFATLIFNNFSIPNYKDTDSIFKDVLPEDWYFFVVNSVAGAGIIDGYTDGTFRPYDYLTRCVLDMSFQRLKTNDGTKPGDNSGHIPFLENLHERLEDRDRITVYESEDPLLEWYQNEDNIIVVLNTWGNEGIVDLTENVNNNALIISDTQIIFETNILLAVGEYSFKIIKDYGMETEKILGFSNFRVNPPAGFRFNEEHAIPPFRGYPDNVYINLYVPENEEQMIIVDGITIAGEESYPFIIVLNRQWIGHEGWINFCDFYIHPGVPDSLGNDHWFQIPVNPVKNNNITLTYNEYSISFDWNPGEDANFTNWVHIDGHQRTGIIDPAIEVVFSEFHGDPGKLMLEITDQTSGVVAELKQAEVISEYKWIEQHMHREENRKRIRFTYSGEGIINLNDPDLYNAQVRVTYTDADLGLYLVRDNVGYVEVDNKPPYPHQAHFYGVNEADNTFSLFIDFNDYICIEDLQLNLLDRIKLHDVNSGIDYYPENRLIPVHSYEWADDSSPYNAVIVDFDFDLIINQREWKIVVTGARDIYGNVMSEPVDINLYLHTQLTGYLKDLNGNVLDNATLKLIKDPPLPDGTGLVRHFERTRFIETNRNGRMNVGLYPGRYYVYGLDKRAADGQIIKTSLDFYIDIPFTNKNEPYKDDINIYEGCISVSGTVYRPEGRSYRDKLLFIRQEYLSQYQDALAQLEASHHNHELSQEERDLMWQRLEAIHEYYIKSVETSLDGSFNTLLKPGEYVLLGKSMGQGIIVEPINLNPYTFVVPEQGVFELDEIINFPPPTVFGTIFDHEGNPLKWCYMEIKNLDTHMFYRVTTDEFGNFEAIIKEEGSFRIESIMNQWNSSDKGKFYQLDIKFDLVLDVDDYVMQNIIYNGDPVVNMNELIAPTPNIIIDILADGQSVPKGYSSINIVGLDHEILPYNVHYIHLMSEISKYELFIPEGNYKISEINCIETRVPAWQGNDYKRISIQKDEGIIETIANGTFESEGYQFEVTGISTVYKVDVAGYFNTVVFFVDEDGEPLINMSIDVEDLTNYWWFWRRTGANGAVYFDIEVDEGEFKEYAIRSYEYNGRRYHLDNVEFTAQHVEYPNRNEKIITVRKPNFFGRIFDGAVKDGIVDDGVEPLENGWLNIRKLSQGEPQDNWIWTNSDELGNFSMMLDEGQYIVESAGGYNSWFEISYRFDIILNESGRLIAVSPLDGTPIQMPINLGKPGPNFRGYLYRVGEMPYEGNQNWEEIGHYGVYFTVREKGIDPNSYLKQPWNYTKWIEVDPTGYFEILMDDTKEYEVTEVYTPRRHYTFSQPLDFAPGENIIVRPPLPNFSGTVEEFDGGYSGRWGGIGLEEVYSGIYIYVEIESDGSFGTDLKIGETYKVRDVYFNREDNSHVRLVVNEEITITQDESVVRNYKLNFKGEIAMEKPLNQHIHVLLKQVVLPESDNYQDYLFNPWNYEMWIDGKFDDAEGKVIFYGYLDEGKEYILLRINDAELNENFLLNGENSTNNLIYGEGKYTLQLDFAPNVIGVIIEEGKPINNAWVSIRTKNEGSFDYDANYNVRHFGTRTNIEGQFRIKLDDGHYVVEGYNTMGYWEGRTWINGKWVQTQYEFIVDNGQLRNKNGVEIEYINLSTNFKGKLFRQNDSGVTEAIQHGWLTIRKLQEDGSIDWSKWENSIWANTDRNGEFNVRLEEGNYKVLEAGGQNFFMRLDIAFSINVDGSLIPGEKAQIDENGFLLIMQKQPNFTGTAYEDFVGGQVINRGHMVIKPQGGNKQEWEKSVWIETDRNGNFKTFLEDGLWEIVELGSPRFWKQIRIPFEVKDGKVSSNIEDLVDQEGRVLVAPPMPNVVGIIKNTSGNIHQSKAWITIKPANAMKHEWENAKWSEYIWDDEQSMYVFKLNLEPGEYKVVEVSANSFNYETNIRFTVNQNLSITSNSLNEEGLIVVNQPEPNVTGIVYVTIDQQEVPIQRGWISVARFDDGKQVALDGTQISTDQMNNAASEVHWHHTIWSETDSMGRFKMKLESGTYKIIEAGGQGIWFRPDTIIIVSDDENYEIEVREPGPNVTLTITGIPGGILGDSDQGWLDVFANENGHKIFRPVRFIEKSEDDSFIFQTTLSNGNYKIGYFGTVNGAIEIEQEFVVSDVTNIVIDLSDISGIITVEGVLKVAGNVVNERAWIAIERNDNEEREIKKIQTLNDGTFSINLPHGTTWRVIEVVTSSGYNQIPDDPQYYYEADNGEMIIDIQ